MTAILAAHDLTYAYRSGTALFDDWSATFYGGEATAITGPSGRGKSTLLYLLGLMLTPDDGEVLIDGKRTTSMSDRARAGLRAHEYGFVFQDAALDSSRTVLDNVTETALYRGQSRTTVRDRAVALLAEFGVNVAPERKPGQVSGGQAQRIALCRALVSAPRLLLADEPTGNLDQESEQVVIGALKNHARSGAAVIIVTHSPRVAEACDRTVRL